MENKKLLTFSIIALFLLNLGTLGFLWAGRLHRPVPPPPPPAHNAADFLAHELHFTPEQQKQFGSMRETHHQRIHAIQDSLHALREQFFDELSAPNASRADSLAAQIGRMQAEIEKLTFDHFRTIRSLCTPEQQKKFDMVIEDALKMMAPPPPPPPGPPDPPPPPPPPAQ